MLGLKQQREGGFGTLFVCAKQGWSTCFVNIFVYFFFVSLTCVSCKSLVQGLSMEHGPVRL